MRVACKDVFSRLFSAMPETYRVCPLSLCSLLGRLFDGKAHIHGPQNLVEFSAIGAGNRLIHFPHVSPVPVDDKGFPTFRADHIFVHL